MTATKSASLESKQYFDEHKETTKSELHKISAKEDLSDEQKKELTNLLLDEVKEKQGNDDFKKHAEIRKSDYKKIRELVIQRVGNPEDVKKEDIQEAVDFFYEKSGKKLPQFEDKNHREISDDTWDIVPDKAKIWDGSEYEIKDVKVKINKEKDIKEFVSGVPEHLIGQQVFSKNAMKRLASKLSDKIPKDQSAIAEMIAAYSGKNEKERYDNFYKKNNIKNMLTGYWDPNLERFSIDNPWMYCGLADGNYVIFYEDTWNCYKASNDDFFSVCFVKN